MHLDKYYFINKFDPDHIKKLDKNISLIYRNYKSSYDSNLLVKIRNFCRKHRRNLYLANNIKLAIKYNYDGAYIPSFNNDFKHLNYKTKSNFLIIGSAHNIKEIRIKELQKIQSIFLSSLFKKNNNFLDLNKFKIFSNYTKKNIIALGGISKKNIKKLSLLNIIGFGGISYFK